MDFEEWAAAEPGMNERDDTARLVKLEARRAWQAGCAAEREACAKVCDDVRNQDARGGNDSYLEGRQMGATVCMNTIRKRSNVQIEWRAAFCASRSNAGLGKISSTMLRPCALWLAVTSWTPSIPWICAPLRKW